MLGHFLGPQQGELKDLATAADRLDDLVRLGGGEHPGHVVGRLFERLEQGVLRLAREHVDLVEDVDLGSAGLPRLTLANRSRMSSTLLLDAASSSWRSNDRPCFDRPQLSHSPHGSPSVPRFSQLSALASTRAEVVLPVPGAVEQIGVADLGLHYCVLQRTNDMLLTADLTERLRSVATVERLIGHAGRLYRPTPTPSARRVGRPPRRRVAGAACPMPSQCHDDERPFPGVAARRSAAHRWLR
jgi:hypothetical protein